MTNEHCFYFAFPICRVVTGLRFQKDNRIIHIQIQDGVLMPRGTIDQSTLQWKRISNFSLLDRGIRNGIDYHTMSWERRAIDLDDLIAPPSHLVTGLRFRMVGTHMNLEMRQTEFDFASGKLDLDTPSVWKSNDNTDSSAERRTPVKLIKPDVPTLSRARSVRTSKTNQYVEFTHTDMDKDVGQTTVPFLDAQDVISIPAVPLSGVGLYHKGQPGYGGFVGLEIFSYNIGPHVQTPKTDTSEEINIVPLQHL